jgi:hypothetical protein
MRNRNRLLAPPDGNQRNEGIHVSYQPAEQIKMQAVNEFAIFALAALATLSAGWLYDRFGWITLNLAVVPLLCAALLAAIRIGRRQQHAPSNKPCP